MKQKDIEWKDACYHADIIRWTGVFSILCALMMGYIAWINRGESTPRALGYQRMIYPGIALLIGGVGAVLQRKYISTVLCVLLAAYGMWLAGTSLAVAVLIRNPFLLITVAIGLALLVPLRSVYIGWKALE